MHAQVYTELRRKCVIKFMDNYDILEVVSSSQYGGKCAITCDTTIRCDLIVLSSHSQPTV